MNAEFQSGSDPRVSSRIDAALRNVGTASPPSGIEGRILTRLAAERLSTAESRSVSPASRFARLSRLSAPALCALSSCLVAAVIVAGSVSHSRHNAPAQPSVAPVLHLPASGVGAASAAHAAGPASAPIPAGESARGHSRRSAQGRARIAPHAKKAPGVVVPNPPSNPQN
jgi:hypothetical protein